MKKSGLDPNGTTLFIQLLNFPDHYLVLLVADDQFRYALITTKAIPTASFPTMALEDIAWLDFDRIRGESMTSNLEERLVGNDGVAKSSGWVSKTR